jgi:hypothetical protein
MLWSAEKPTQNAMLSVNCVTGRQESYGGVLVYT